MVRLLFQDIFKKLLKHIAYVRLTDFLLLGAVYKLALLLLLGYYLKCAPIFHRCIPL